MTKEENYTLLATASVARLRDAISRHIVFSVGSTLGRINLYSVDWNDNTFWTANNQATWGAVTFRENECIAAFFQGKSDKISIDPLTNLPISTEPWQSVAEGVPIDLLELGLSPGHSIEYVLGASNQCITSILWGRKNVLYSTRDMGTTWKNGASLLRNDLDPLAHELPYWRSIYDLNEHQADCIARIIEKYDTSQRRNSIDITREISDLLGNRVPKTGDLDAIAVLTRMGFIVNL